MAGGLTRCRRAVVARRTIASDAAMIHPRASKLHRTPVAHATIARRGDVAGGLTRCRRAVVARRTVCGKSWMLKVYCRECRRRGVTHLTALVGGNVAWRLANRKSSIVTGRAIPCHASVVHTCASEFCSADMTSTAIFAGRDMS